MRSYLRSGEVWIALGVIALGAFMMVQTTQINVSANYARVGPRVFPWIVSSVLVLLGLGLMRDALTGRWIKDEGAEGDLPPLDRPGLLWLGIGLGLYLLTIKFAGFPIASGLLFAFTARAFASQRIVLDLAIGLGLGIAVYVGFHHGLGLTLPAGILEVVLG
jgi:putative tricarboxylic transport membrane protein